MDFLKIIAQRKSIRRFNGRKIEKDIIQSIIKAGTEAPTACNHQLHHFVVVDHKELKSKLQKISGSNDHFLNASHLVVVCFQMGWNHNKYAVVQSTAAVTYHSILAAQKWGVGAVWNAGIGNVDKIRKLLNIPTTFQVLGIVCLGYPDLHQIESKPPRRDVDIVTSYNTFERDNNHTFPLKSGAKIRYEKIKNNRNSVAVHSPRKWTISQIKNWRAFSVFAKSPTPGIYVSRRLGAEMLQELKYLEHIDPTAKVLEILPFGGSYTVRILNFVESEALHICELSDNNLVFVEERVKNELNQNVVLKKAIFDENLSLPFKNDSFDMVIMPQILETLPDIDPLLNEVSRVLTLNGTAIISVRNILSWFGIFYYLKIIKQQVSNFGPYAPIFVPKLKRRLRRDFLIEDEFGVSPSAHRIGKVSINFKKNFSRLWVARLKKFNNS